jgi:uncharacterized damage-inducible protein DinB
VRVVTASVPGTRSAAQRDAVLTLLLQPPAPSLHGQPVRSAESLAAAAAFLAGTAQAVRRLLRELDDTRAAQRPAAGGFSLCQHLWHLADIEELGWRPRFERILAEVRPRLPGVDGDRLARERNYAALPWRPAARRFLAQRRASLVALALFDPDVLLRPVSFAGVRSRAAGVLAAAVAHDLEHRQQMAQCWRAHRDGGATRRRRTR